MAIKNRGVLAVADSSFVGGGAADAGGAIANAGTATVTRSLFDTNESTTGGAISNSGTFTLETSTIRNGHASFGGAISNKGSAGTAMTIVGTTTTNNTSDNVGGGINNNGATVNLVNSTVSGNAARDDFDANVRPSGGGIYNDGTLNVTNATLVGNTATVGSAIANQGSTAFKNTIVAKAINALGGNNCASALQSAGNNLDSGTTCGFNAAGDRRNTNPRRNALATDGGPTRTHTVRADSLEPVMHFR